MPSGQPLSSGVSKFYKTIPTTDHEAVNKIERNVCSASFWSIFRQNLLKSI